MSWIGDFPEDFTTVPVMFSTHDAKGGPTAPSGAIDADDIRIYKNGDAAQKTTTNGVTIASPFDSITGLHRVLIDTSNDTGDTGFWTAGSQYTVVLSTDTETVQGQSLLKVLATFGIELYGALKPTTSGRKLDVSAGGEAGVDWANIGSPTTTVNLSGTTVKTATDVETDTADIQSRLPAALGANGNIKADVRDYNGAAGTFSGGRPEVNASHLAGTAYATQRDALVDLIWDEVLTGATHNVAASAGRRLREISGNIVVSGTAQAGSTNSITLAAGASGTNGTYDPALIRIVAGTGVGQARLIIDYNGTSKVAIVDRDWRTAPDNTSDYEIVAAPNLMSTNEGLAQAGGAATITLNSSASAVNNTYNGQLVVIRTGTGQDQSRIITAYNGTTKVATVGEAWVTQPDSSSGYMLLPVGRSLVVAMNADTLTASAVASDAVTEIQSGLSTLNAAGVRSAVGLASANLDTQLSAIDDFLDTEIAAIKAKTDNLPASPAATGDIPSAASIADAVWEEDITDHSGTTDSTAEALAGASSAGDPWGVNIPGAYSAGTAGYIVGTNLDATVSSRASQTSLNTLDDLVDTEVAAIKAKTDSLTFTVAGQVDSNVQYVNDVQVAGTGATNDPWGPA